MGPGGLAARIAMASAFMIFCALLIQQTRGMIEAHFGIFVLLAFLLYYRDWRPIVAAAGVIAAHHLSFNYMQAAGLGVYVLLNGPNLGIILVHAAYVVMEAAVLVYMAIHLRQEAVESAQVAGLAERIGEGDLASVPVAESLKGLPLLARVDEMRKRLAETLAGVNRQSGEMTRTASEMMASSRQVDDAMGRQSEATQNIAATIEQLTVSIQHLSDSADEAQRLAEKSGLSSEASADVVRSATDEINSIAESIGTLADSMERLGGQFDSVAKVVGLIKDIADQTNLLALNAAIEAARAGEQGRGFAVVADEVRKLAERTRQATEEIGTTMQEMQSSKVRALTGISEAVQKAGSGVQLADRAGEAIDSMGRDVLRVRDVVVGITHGLREQSSATTEIARNVEQVSSMAQSTSLAAKAVMQESDGLSRIANALASSVVRFRLP
jgi:methyl-accepting chemotaxis protein